jgi:hypothetical protein
LSEKPNGGGNRTLKIASFGEIATSTLFGFQGAENRLG